MTEKIISFLKGKREICIIFFDFTHVNSGSRPSSFLSTSARPLPPPPAPSSILSPSASAVLLLCQACRKPAYFPDEDTLRRVPENVAISRLVAKHQRRQYEDGQITAKTDAPVPDCQVCDGKAKILYESIFSVV